MSAPLKRLWLGIRFPDLPLTAIREKPLEGNTVPVIVVASRRVVCACPIATAAGVRPGMDATTATVLAGCASIDRDETREEAAIDLLAHALYQFSPHIEKHQGLGEKGLLLEISSCLQLFGGTLSLCDQVFNCLSSYGHAIAPALAHTAPAAWYLSWAGHPVTGDETLSTFIDRLHRLPVTLLHDYPAAVASLTKTGFSTFGDLARQIEGKSLASFRKRLGAAFTDALCAIYDIDQHFSQSALFETPRDVFRPTETFAEEIQLEFPVTQVDLLAPAIETLLITLADHLRRYQYQCQTLEWHILDIQRNRQIIKVMADTPQSDWHLFYDLTLIQFNATDLPFEVDVIRLRCAQVAPLQAGSLGLSFTQGQRQKRSQQDMTVVIAKLKARLGDACVYRVAYRDNLLPEYSNQRLGPALADRPALPLPAIHKRALRPAWLLPAPEQIESRQGRLFWHGYITLLQGPERLIGHWWQNPAARDYYMAARQDHMRLWVYFDLYRKLWYVQGVFA